MCQGKFYNDNKTWNLGMIQEVTNMTNIVGLESHH